MTLKLFEDLAKSANEKGWLVLNCFQFGVNAWRCNLQRRSESGATEEIFTAFGDGKTPSEALRATMFNMENAVPRKDLTRKARGPAPDNKAPKLTPQQQEAQNIRLLEGSDVAKHFVAATDELLAVIAELRDAGTRSHD